MPPPELVKPWSTAYAWRASLSAIVPAIGRTAGRHASAVPAQARSAFTGSSDSGRSDSSNTRSCARPASTLTVVSRAPSGRRVACAAPDQRRNSGPERAVHTPSSHLTLLIWCLPKPARGSSTTRTRVAPSTAMTLRSTTAVCGSPGKASASRDSRDWVAVTQRLCQIRLPGS